MVGGEKEVVGIVFFELFDVGGDCMVNFFEWFYIC